MVYKRDMDEADGWQSRVDVVTSRYHNPSLPPPPLPLLRVPLFFVSISCNCVAAGAGVDNKAYFAQAVSEYVERNGCKYFQVKTACLKTAYSP